MNIRDIIINLQIVENNLRELPTGRETSLAITKVQEAIMWAKEVVELAPEPTYHVERTIFEPPVILKIEKFDRRITKETEHLHIGCTIDSNTMVCHDHDSGSPLPRLED